MLQWYLKRGDYDCCTGLSGVTDTYLSFPRQIDMGKRLGPSKSSSFLLRFRAAHERLRGTHIQSQTEPCKATTKQCGCDRGTPKGRVSTISIPSWSSVTITFSPTFDRRWKVRDSYYYYLSIYLLLLLVLPKLKSQSACDP